MGLAYDILANPAIQPLTRGLFNQKVGPQQMARTIIDPIPWTPRQSLTGQYNTDVSNVRLNLTLNPNTLTPMSETASVESGFVSNLSSGTWALARYPVTSIKVADAEASQWVDTMMDPAGYISRQFSSLAVQHMAVQAGLLLAATSSYNSANRVTGASSLGAAAYDWIGALQTALQALLDGDTYAEGDPLVCYVTPGLATAMVKSTQGQASLTTADAQYKQSILQTSKVGALISQWLGAPVTTIIPRLKYVNAAGTSINPFYNSTSDSFILTNLRAGEYATHFFANNLAGSAAPLVGMAADAAVGPGATFDYMVQEGRGFRGVDITGSVRYQYALSNDKAGYLIQGTL